jgi:hypothetical protein
MSSGIYIIKNKIDNKIYVGSSLNVDYRKQKHFWMLKKNVHDNQHLQNSFNLYGESNFEFTIVEECENENLIHRENFYIDYYQSNLSQYGYNLAKVNEFRRNTFNDEVKVQISKTNLKKNGNFLKFSLTNIETSEIFIFDSLVEAAEYLIGKGFAKGKPRNVRMCVSNCLRGIKLDNGHKGSIRKTCYKHKFKIIN